MKKILLAAVLAGVVLWVWGFISHTVIPLYDNSLLAFTDPDAITQALLANAPQSGMYFLPNYPRTEGMTAEQMKAAEKKIEEQMMKGPFMLASIRIGGWGSFPYHLVVEYITDVISALLVCLVLVQLKEMSFWKRVLQVEWIGLVGFASINLPMWNWYAFSAAFTLADLFDLVVGWFLVGMVLAKLLAPKGMEEKPVGG